MVGRLPLEWLMMMVSVACSSADRLSSLYEFGGRLSI